MDYVYKTANVLVDYALINYVLINNVLINYAFQLHRSVQVLWSGYMLFQVVHLVSFYRLTFLRARTKGKCGM